ncbi:MAG: class I SAM-dependent methyltransferase [Candidatus Promineifilaceae bacterium]|nr:class I SAM-dependent methyltransferase [Candidatus Promineifilaceae bacterium]
MDPIRDPEENEITHLHQIGRLDRARVLEIGCGDGRLTWRYASRAASVTGLDPDPESLAVALAERPAALTDKVSFLTGDAARLPLADERFDVVLMAWSL